MAESASELTRSLQEFAEVLTKSGFLTVISRINNDLKKYNKLLVDLETLGLHVTSNILEEITVIEKLFNKNEEDLQVINKINGQQISFANAAILALEEASSKTEAMLTEKFLNSSADELSERNETKHHTEDNIISSTDIIEENSEITDSDSNFITSFTQLEVAENPAMNTEDEAMNNEDILQNNEDEVINSEDVAINPDTDDDRDNTITMANITGAFNDADISDNKAMATIQDVTTESENSGDQELDIITEETVQEEEASTVTAELDFADEMRKMKKEALLRNEIEKNSSHLVPEIDDESHVDEDQLFKQELSGKETVGGFLLEHQSSEEQQHQVSEVEIHNFVNLEVSPEGSGDGLFEEDYNGIVNDKDIEYNTLEVAEGSGSGDYEDIGNDDVDYMTMEEYIIIPQYTLFLSFCMTLQNPKCQSVSQSVSLCVQFMVKNVLPKKCITKRAPA